MDARAEATCLGVRRARPHHPRATAYAPAPSPGPRGATSPLPCVLLWEKGYKAVRRQDRRPPRVSDLWAVRHVSLGTRRSALWHLPCPPTAATLRSWAGRRARLAPRVDGSLTVLKRGPRTGACPGGPHAADLVAHVFSLDVPIRRWVRALT